MQLDLLDQFQFIFNKNRSQIINDALVFFFNKINKRESQYFKFRKNILKEDENDKI